MKQMQHRALSVRQPWAWLLVNGPEPGVAYKSVENRTRRSAYTGRLYIHASKTMTRNEYLACERFCLSLPRDVEWKLPPFEELQRECGGVIGMVWMCDCVDDFPFGKPQPWFTGPFGYVFNNPVPLKFAPCSGALNFFDIPARVANHLEKR